MSTSRKIDKLPISLETSEAIRLFRPFNVLLLTLAVVCDLLSGFVSPEYDVLVELVMTETLLILALLEVTGVDLVLVCESAAAARTKATMDTTALRKTKSICAKIARARGSDNIFSGLSVLLWGLSDSFQIVIPRSENMANCVSALSLTPFPMLSRYNLTMVFHGGGSCLGIPKIIVFITDLH